MHAGQWLSLVAARAWAVAGGSKDRAILGPGVAVPTPPQKKDFQKKNYYI